jgi:hypothetical protein
LKSKGGSGSIAELINRDDLIAALQQEIARKIQQENGPAFKPYDPEEPEYSDKPEFEHLKAESSEVERMRLRSPGCVPRDVPIPHGAMTTGLAEDVIKVELFKLLPECKRLGITVIIDS